MAEKKVEEKPDEQVSSEPEEKPEAPAKPVVTEDEDGGVRVQLDEDRPQPRRERRENWKAQREEEIRRVREENEALRQQQARLEGQMQARLAQMERQMPRGEDPYEREVREIRRQQELIQRTLRSGSVQSEPEIEQLRDRYYELDSRSKDLDRQRIKHEVMQEWQRQQQQQAGQYEEQVLRSEFPEVIQHQQAIRWATGRYHQMVAEGKPPILATSRAALQEAAEHYGLRTPNIPRASEAQRQRYAAVPAQAGTKTSSNEIRLEAGQKKMALARWPHLEEHEAYAKMAALLRKVDGERSEA